MDGSLNPQPSSSKRVEPAEPSTSGHPIEPNKMNSESDLSFGETVKMPCTAKNHYGDMASSNPMDAEIDPLKRSSSMPTMLTLDVVPEDEAGPIPPIHPNCKEEIEDKNSMGFFHIEETVEDVITIENETAIFECKVMQDLNPTCTWHKDGKTLQTEERITIKKNGAWHRLEIKHVTASDQGIYTIECRHNKQYISIKGRLFVAPRKISDRVFYYKIPYTGPGIIKHLKNLKVFKGEDILLKAEFNFGAINYIWFKNSDVILQDLRYMIQRNGKEASLTILNAKPTDAGVYFVVALTEQGYLSSLADVQVGDRNEIRHLTPLIEERLPDEVEVVIGESLRLDLKVNADANTIIIWDKDKTDQIPSYLTVDYGCNYIGIKLPVLLTSAAGEYRVTLKNLAMHQEVTASTKVKVKNQSDIRTAVNLLRPLDSAVACCGAMVSFDCVFDLDDSKYYYVVWYVGHYKVERTNSHFHVMNCGGMFFLYIKKLEPSMAGEVVCELRQSWPHRKIGIVKKVYARLVIVPLLMLQEATTRPFLTGKLYYERDTKETSVKIENIESNGFFLGEVTEDPDILLKIAYCRLNNEGLYFAYVVRGATTAAAHASLKIYAGNEIRQYVIFEWNDSITENNCWYRIESGQLNGSYTLAGTTSRPFFKIEYPQLDKIMIFRIKAVEPMRRIYDSDVYIVPPPEMELKLAVPLQINPMEIFSEKYTKTNTIIGTGTFGTVLLVKEKISSEYFAAKFVKNSNPRKNEYTLKEFHIMKKLRHPKIIELIGFYEANNMYAFVMEYCWGGELFDRLVEELYLKEVDVVGYLKQICQALEYLHKKAIVHLDLKPENIICLNPNSTQVKLIDFGLARNVNEYIPRGVYGTRDYVCPEIINYNPITTASDMWSLGVVTYLLLSGIMPFVGVDWMERSANIIRTRYYYNDYAFREVSDLAKDFVDHLLVREPKDRLTATKALQHAWIKHGPPLGAKSKHLHKMRRNLKSYLAEYRSKWQLAGNVLIAAHRMRKAMKLCEDETGNASNMM